MLPRTCADCGEVRAQVPSSVGRPNRTDSTSVNSRTGAWPSGDQAKWRRIECRCSLVSHFKKTDGIVRPSMIHNHHLKDTLVKLQGLARFAERFGNDPGSRAQLCWRAYAGHGSPGATSP
jgi:hypothetical protein